MNNLHESFGEANFDFEIDTLQADMIRPIVSHKMGSSLQYDELTVIQFSDQRCTVWSDDRILSTVIPICRKIEEEGNLFKGRRRSKWGKKMFIENRIHSRGVGAE